MGCWRGMIVCVWAVACLGCGDHETDGTFTAMSWNLYLGAPAEPLLAVRTEAELAAAVTKVLGVAVSTNFPARAHAIADTIAQENPDIVALQEVVRWQAGGEATVAEDYLDILMAALALRGLHYEPAVVGTNLQLQFAIGALDLSFTDRDVVLVRRDGVRSTVEVTATSAAHFANNLVVESPRGPISILRGYAIVDARIAGRSFRFLATHLEAASEPVRFAQAAELLAGPLATALPTIAVGDFNFTPTAAPWGDLRRAGFADVWASVYPDNPGFTCCQDPDLRNPDSKLSERIDYLWATDTFQIESAELLANTPASRTPGGLWPSDHATVGGRVTLAQ